MTKDEAKYHQDIGRCNVLEQQLKERIKKAGINRNRLAYEFAEITGLSESTAFAFIVKFAKPQIISSDASRYSEIQLEKIAVLYSLVELKENDPLVELTRKVNPNFDYPLKKGYSYRKSSQKEYLQEENPSASIRVKFSDNKMNITQEQKTELERIALQYALANKQTTK